MSDTQNKSRDLSQKGGFSACTYEPATSILSAMGWFLGPPVDQVQILLEEELLGVANLNQRRLDVFEQYPEYNNEKSGWRFERKITRVPPLEASLTANVHDRYEEVYIYKRPIALVGQTVKDPPTNTTDSAVGRDNFHARQFSEQSSNLVNKLLFNLAELTPAELDQCLINDEHFAIAAFAKNPVFFRHLSELFGIDQEVLNILFEYDQKAWVGSVRRQLTPGKVLSLRERITSRMEVYAKNAVALREILPLHDGPRYAFYDVGCQFGYMMVEAASLGFKKVHGAEINPDLVSVPKRLAEFVDRAYSSELRYAVGDFGKLDLETNTYDVVTCVDVLEHTPDIELTLARMIDLLTPTGIIYIYQGNAHSFALATKEPHYQLPAITTFSTELALNILEHLGMVSDKRPYVVKQWPTLERIRACAEKNEAVMEVLGHKTNIRSGQKFPEARDVKKLQSALSRSVDEYLMPNLSPSLSRDTRKAFERFLLQMEDNIGNYSKIEFAQRYLMGSWNIFIRRRC